MIKIILLSLMCSLCSCAPPPSSTPQTSPPVGQCPADTPEGLAPPDDSTLLFLASAPHGVQDYECSSGKWSLREPRAELFDSSVVPQLRVLHRAGPSWLSVDSSFVVGQKSQEASPDAQSIPWLLVKVASRGGFGSGLMSKVTWIQRLSTVGGLSPSADTCAATTPTRTAVVPYGAVYAFYVPTPAGGKSVRCGAPSPG